MEWNQGQKQTIIVIYDSNDTVVVDKVLSFFNKRYLSIRYPEEEENDPHFIFKYGR